MNTARCALLVLCVLWPLRALPATHAVGRAQGGGLIAFRQALLDASVDTRVVIVATHPDDPYRGMSLLLRRRHGCDVTVVIATRGGGGQNAVGPEQGAELDVIRTRETLEAARLLDVKVRFLDLPDFGYARTAHEALDHWRLLQPLARLRDALRELRPDLVITPHAPGEPHGQKRAVFHLLGECIAGSEGPKPRYLRGVALDGSEQPELSLDLDAVDPVRGTTYQEEAFRAMQEHKTQQPFRPIDEAVPPKLALRLVSGGPASLTSGLRGLWQYASELERASANADAPHTLSWLRQRLADLPMIPEQPELRRRFDPVDLAMQVLPMLQQLRAAVTDGSDLALRLDRRIEALGRAVLAGAVVRLSWEGAEFCDATTARIQLPLRVHNGGRFDVTVRAVGLLPAEGGSRLDNGDNGDALTLTVPPRSDAKLPLVVERSPDAAHDTDLVLQLRVAIGTKVTVSALVSRSVRAIEPLAIEAVPQSDFLVSDGGGDIRFSLGFRKPLGTDVHGVLAKIAPITLTTLPESDGLPHPIPIDLPANTSARRLQIRLRVAPWPRDADAVTLPVRRALFYVEGIHGRAPPPRTRCEVRIHPVRLRVPSDLRVAIVRGPDNTIQEALRSFGLDVQTLEVESLARASLDDYDTVVIASRALLRRASDLLPQVPRFVSYAERGGHLVVLYHKEQEFNLSETGVQLAPYPLELGRERVTREDAPVRVLLPSHRLMTWPNRIEPGDWDGWVQERGLYFPATYDPRYEQLLSIQELAVKELADVVAPRDPPEFEPQRGALLFARAGQGSYVYCALVIHRQLRAFHAGAARLLVNLVTPPAWDTRKVR